MQQIDTMLLGDYVLTMNDAFDVIKDGALAVNGREIVAVGLAEELRRHFDPARTIAGQGRLLMPGLVNTHCHAAMAYFRGLADDMHLRQWLEQHIWPAENRLLSPEFVADAVELACLEMLKGGITTVNDMYFFCESTAQTAKKMGMRALVGAGILDFPTVSGRSADDYLAKAEEFIRRWQSDDLVNGCVAPHAAYTCGPDTLKKAKTLADRLGCLMHMHVSETAWEVEEIGRRFGRRPVEHCAELGVLDARVVAVHCVWVDDHDIDLLAKHGVGVSHCVESNLKLASGFAPVVKMLHAGLSVSFGTDGAASNNDLNLLGEMSTAAKLHKALVNDPTALDAKTVLLMATRQGAEVLGLADRIGSLEPGKCADIISFDLNKPHLSPVYDVCSHIVYAASASDIDLVMINGKILVQDGSVMACDESEILRKADVWKQKISPNGSAL
jgi:5-methylthioadenosine/S-adenosylhomocysteine deaminase